MRIRRRVRRGLILRDTLTLVHLSGAPFTPSMRAMAPAPADASAEAEGSDRSASSRAPTHGTAGGWWRVLAAGALVMAVLFGRACERYVPRYQTLPVLDWLQASPLFDQAAAIPPAQDLADGMIDVEPRIPYYWDEYTVFSTTFLSGTSTVVRAMGGLRDTGVLRKENPAPTGRPGPITAPDQTSLLLNVLVFHGADQASAWVDLRSLELDIGRHDYLYGSFRITGPDEPDRLWITRATPGPAEPQAGHALLVARRGPVAFEVRTVETRPSSRDPRDIPDLNARAADLARSAAKQWSDWLMTQPYARSW